MSSQDKIRFWKMIQLASGVAGVVGFCFFLLGVFCSMFQVGDQRGSSVINYLGYGMVMIGLPAVFAALSAACVAHVRLWWIKN